MSSKAPPPSREDRLAKALRDNLAKRKALQRSKRTRADVDGDTPSSATDDAVQSPPATGNEPQG